MMGRLSEAQERYDRDLRIVCNVRLDKINVHTHFATLRIKNKIQKFLFNSGQFHRNFLKILRSHFVIFIMIIRNYSVLTEMRQSVPPPVLLRHGWFLFLSVSRAQMTRGQRRSPSGRAIRQKIHHRDNRVIIILSYCANVCWRFIIHIESR